MAFFFLEQPQFDWQPYPRAKQEVIYLLLVTTGLQPWLCFQNLQTGTIAFM